MAATPGRRNRRSGPTLAAAGFGLAAVGVLDFYTGLEVRIFPLYFLPVGWVAWSLRRTWAVSFAGLSSAVWWLANAASGADYSSSWVWPVNALSQLVAFGSIGWLVAELRRRLRLEEALSRRDPLTRLVNRRGFEERAGRHLDAARRSGAALSIAYVDLDGFKRVNDERGHEEGDKVLHHVAYVLVSQLRPRDVVARMGGDEFAALLPGAGADAARECMERVAEAVREEMAEHGWEVGLSVGVAVFEGAPASLAEALKVADELMYEVKRSGKGRVEVRKAGDHSGPGAVSSAPVAR